MVAEGSRRAGTGAAIAVVAGSRRRSGAGNSSGSRRDQTPLGQENAEGLQFKRKRNFRQMESIRKLVGGLYPK